MRIAFTLLTTLFFVFVQSDVYAQRNFELNDLDKLYTLTDPQISPDGKSILIIVTKPDTVTNRNKSFVYRVDVATGGTQQLTFERAFVGFPRWSPSGNSIAFISADAAGKGQIFVMSTSGGEAKKITSSPTGVQQFHWSPDGNTFAFTQADVVSNKKEIEKGYDAFEVKNNSIFLTAKPSPTHIWLISATGGEAKRLTSGSWTIPAANAPCISWSPDGKQIAFQSNESPYSGESIGFVKIVDIASGKVNRITSSQVSSNALHRERKPVFSPDGNSLVYQRNLENAAYGFNVYLTSVDQDSPKNLTIKLDRCFYRAEWSTDSKAIFVAASDFNTTSLWLQPINGTAKKLNLNNLCITGSNWYEYSVGKNNVVAFIASNSQSPQELYFMASPDAAPKQLTNLHRELQTITFGKQETFTWKSDEFTPNGVLTFPPDFNPSKKYPLVVAPHGGPRASSIESFNSSIQLRAAHGYIVFQPNFRGSDNMGYRFSEAINGDAGEGPGRDVMNGLAELKKRNYIDSNKIAVTGWSYGGFMTTWLIGNYSGWKCAVAGASVTDWIAQYTQSDLGSMFGFEQGKGKSPFTDKKVKENWLKNSPITYAENVKTPTLIISNTGDERVPISQSYTYYRVLQDNGVESKFIAFPIAGHNPTDPIRFKEYNRFVLEWLDKYLK
jgi:dipeptidyl aminopeptidase/acylaminoacyl peptidase